MRAQVRHSSDDIPPWISTVLDSFPDPKLKFCIDEAAKLPMGTAPYGDQDGMLQMEELRGLLADPEFDGSSAGPKRDQHNYLVAVFALVSMGRDCTSAISQTLAGSSVSLKVLRDTLRKVYAHRSSRIRVVLEEHGGRYTLRREECVPAWLLEAVHAHLSETPFASYLSFATEFSKNATQPFSEEKALEIIRELKQVVKDPDFVRADQMVRVLHAIVAFNLLGKGPDCTADTLNKYTGGGDASRIRGLHAALIKKLSTYYGTAGIRNPSRIVLTGCHAGGKGYKVEVRPRPKCQTLSTEAAKEYKLQHKDCVWSIEKLYEPVTPHPTAGPLPNSAAVTLGTANTLLVASDPISCPATLVNLLGLLGLRMPMVFPNGLLASGSSPDPSHISRPSMSILASRDVHLDKRGNRLFIVPVHGAEFQSLWILAQYAAWVRGLNPDGDSVFELFMRLPLIGIPTGGQSEQAVHRVVAIDLSAPGKQVICSPCQMDDITAVLRSLPVPATQADNLVSHIRSARQTVHFDRISLPSHGSGHVYGEVARYLLFGHLPEKLVGEVNLRTLKGKCAYVEEIVRALCRGEAVAVWGDSAEWLASDPLFIACLRSGQAQIEFLSPPENSTGEMADLSGIQEAGYNVRLQPIDGPSRLDLTRIGNDKLLIRERGVADEVEFWEVRRGQALFGLLSDMLCPVGRDVSIRKDKNNV